MKEGKQWAVRARRLGDDNETNTHSGSSKCFSNCNIWTAVIVSADLSFSTLSLTASDANTLSESTPADLM